MPQARKVNQHGLQASNCLTGDIPEFLSESPLAYVDLSHNKLNSTVPDSWLDNTSLQYFAAGYNSLHGQIPGPSLETDLLLKDWGSQSEGLSVLKCNVHSGRFMDSVGAVNVLVLFPVRAHDFGLRSQSVDCSDA